MFFTDKFLSIIVLFELMVVVLFQRASEQSIRTVSVNKPHWTCCGVPTSVVNEPARWSSSSRAASRAEPARYDHCSGGIHCARFHPPAPTRRHHDERQTPPPRWLVARARRGAKQCACHKKRECVAVCNVPHAVAATTLVSLRFNVSSIPAIPPAACTCCRRYSRI